jgi:hypothetical protein
MKVSTYKSLLTNKKTMLVIGNNLPYSKGYQELQITFYKGAWRVDITDGYSIQFSKVLPRDKGIKSLINLYYRG